MDEPKPKRPWWRTKRTWAAALLLLAAAYPAGVGPLFYAYGRGWIGGTVPFDYAAPLMRVLGQPGRDVPATWLRDYAIWAGDVGLRHRAAASD